MTVVWTAEAKEAINPRTREALLPSKTIAEKSLPKKLAEVLSKLQEEEPRIDWAKLRPLFLCTDDEGRTKLASALSAYWPRADVHARVGIAALLRDEAKSREVVAQWVDAGHAVEHIYSVVLDLEQARDAVARRKASRSYYELVATFGDALLPILLEVFESPRDEFDLWHCARSLALYDDARAAEKLATVLRRAKIRPYASDFFIRFPHHAEAVLAPLGKGKTKLAELARELLESARRKAEAGPLSEEASPDELPPILVIPPWTLKKRPQPPSLEVDRPMPPRPEHVRLDPKIAEAALADAKLAQAGVPAMAGELVKECGLLGPDAHRDFFVYKSYAVPEDVRLAWWDAGAKVYSYAVDVADYMLAKHGERAIDGLVKYVAGPFAYASEARGEGLLGVDSPRLAATLVKYLHKRERRSLALRWMHAHGETAAFALAPLVLSGEESADWVMRMLVQDGVDVVKAAAPWGDAVRALLEEWLRFDRRNIIPKKLAKMPPAWKPDTYSRPIGKNGKPLPASAVDVIGVMLAISRPDDPYAGIEDVKAACEPRSLAEFAWDVARSWENNGAKSQADWMRDALIWFADDEVVRRTTPAMKVDNVVDALEAIATPAAQMELVTIAAKGNWVGDQALARIAEAKSMTLDELEDRIVPTAGLDAKGELELDYGARKLRVGFDSRLEPYVVGEDGGKSKALPPARKTDDTEKAEAAKRIWQDLKEDVGALAMRRLNALERAMCAGRTWNAADFDALFVRHPLTSHIAKGLVWVALPDTRFRIAEDGTFADVHEQHVTIGDRRVRIAHPMRDGTLEAWQDVLADYQLVQPFPQVARTIRAGANLDGIIARRSDDGRVIEVGIAPTERDELGAKLRAYSRSWTRPMYAASGETHIASSDSRAPITHLRVWFTRKRATYPISDVPEIDISEALHDVLD